MWNHLLRWRGQAGAIESQTMISDTSGRVSLAGRTLTRYNHPFYFEDGDLESFKNDWESNYFYGYQTTSAPPTKQGFAFILVDNLESGRQAWQYLVGQRRVRRAPDLSYDTPNPVTSSVDFFDEPFIQLGPFDKHSLKLVGKKEMYIPYNNNGALAQPLDDLVGPHFWNPEHVRFELHRVWVVEAELRDGERHVMPRKTFYFDEDTGNGVMMDGYDSEGQLWHLAMAAQTVMPEFPGVFLENFITMDLLKGTMSSFTWNELNPQYEKVEPYSARVMTPEYMGAEALR